MGSRRSMEQEHRRQFILDAARQLFERQGVEETGMEEIARAAEYTRRTLYAYFKSRDEVFLQIYHQDLAARWQLQQQAMAERESGLDKLMAWAWTFFAFSREHPYTLHLQFYWDLHGIAKERVGDHTFAAFRSLNEAVADGLRQVLRKGVEDGSLRPDLDVDMCLSHFLYSLRAVLHRALFPAYSFASFEPRAFVAAFLELFARGIRAAGPVDHDAT